jgi:hypothetical protein
MVNQVNLLRKDIASKLGNDVVDDLVLTNQDQGEQASETRQQLIELGCLMDGEDIPIAHYDDDLTHLAVLQGKLPTLMQAAQQAPLANVMPQLISIYNHAQMHVQQAAAKKMNPQVLQPMAEQVAQLGQMLQQVQGQAMPPPNIPSVPPPMPNHGQPRPHQHQAQPLHVKEARQEARHPSESSKAVGILRNSPVPIPPNQARPFEHSPVNLTPNINTGKPQ